MQYEPEKRLLYLIGQPGAGKSSLLRLVTKDIPYQVESKPFGHLRYTENSGVQLGVIRESFSGTDALPMNVQPIVANWIYETSETNILAEGDRLANDSFFLSVQEAGWNLTVVYLRCPNDVAQERRDARGSKQNPQWIKGRITKAEKLASKWVSPEWILDAHLPLPELAARLQEHPVIEQLQVRGNRLLLA